MPPGRVSDWPVGYSYPTNTGGAESRSATGDLDRAAGYWTPDVLVTAGLGVVVEGREAYRRAFEQEPGLIYRREPVQIDVSPDFPIAWETGDWTGHRVGGDETPVILGRYSAQWVRIGGRWLIRSELFVALRCDGDACGWPVATH